MMAALGVTKDKPELQLHMKTIDTGKKYYDGKGFKIKYRGELCNPYKRAFKELAKAIKKSNNR